MKISHHHPALAVLVLAAAGAIATTITNGCSSTSGSGPGPASDCTTELATARVAMENEIYRLDQLESPPSEPGGIDFRAAEAAYQNAFATCDSSSEAGFGLALASFFVVTQDPEVVATWDRWSAFVDTASFFEHDIPGSARSLPAMGGSPFRVGEPAPDPAGLARSIVLLPFAALTDPPQFSELQDLVRTEIVSRLDLGIELLGDVATDPGFRYTVTPKMQGDIGADPLELDLTEVEAILAASNVFGAFADLITAFNVDVGTYDSLGLLAALQQDSPFLGLADGGAARMADVRTRMLAAADRIDAAIDALEAETDSQDDDIIVIEGEGTHGGPSEADLAEVRDRVDEVRNALNGPYVVNVDFDGDGIETAVTIDLHAFLTDPPANLKSLLPPYTARVVGESEWGGASDVEREGLCPVIVWDAATFENWIFPDPTMGGLFPGMTDARLKDLFGMTAEGWTQEMSPCEPPQPVAFCGRVYDLNSGSGIAGAIVTISLAGNEAVTDDGGYFCFESDVAVHAEHVSYAIAADANGYQSWSVEQPWGQHPEFLEIGLTSIPARYAAKP